MAYENRQPDAAAYISEREDAMRANRLAANPNLRMLPAMSTQRNRMPEDVQRETKPEAEKHEEAPPAEPPPIDYAQYSQAILQALRAIEGNVDLNVEETQEVARILNMYTQQENNTLRIAVALLVGALAGFLLSVTLSRRPSAL